MTDTIERVRNIRRALRKAQKHGGGAEFADAMKELGSYVPSLGTALVEQWNDSYMDNADEGDSLDDNLADAIDQVIYDECWESVKEAVDEAVAKIRNRIVNIAAGSAILLTSRVLDQFDSCPAACLSAEQVRQDVRNFRPV